MYCKWTCEVNQVYVRFIMHDFVVSRGRLAWTPGSILPLETDVLSIPGVQSFF